MSIEVIMFDMGKVIFDYDFDIAFQAYIKKSLKPANMKSLLELELLQQYELGNLDTNSFFKQFSQAASYNGSFNEFSTAWNNIFTPIEGTLELLPKLAKNYRLVLLTNICDLHFSFLRERYPRAFILFEKLFASYQMRLRKPDIAIYKEVIKTLDIAPEKIFFTDDIEENIKAARQCSIEAYQFISPQDLIKHLNSREILC
ncbi:MAG: HAD family phosphatase [Elusimicrobiota bacterium]|jgi:putative hydrolase of the HAD superfamily|nr:HAD family phosphatase [Elusimicrobiota bacterium]